MNKNTIQSFETIDQGIAKHMNKWGIPLIKFSFAIIFIWFGILKPLFTTMLLELVEMMQ